MTLLGFVRTVPSHGPPPTSQVTRQDSLQPPSLIIVTVTSCVDVLKGTLVGVFSCKQENTPLQENTPTRVPFKTSTQDVTVTIISYFISYVIVYTILTT